MTTFQETLRQLNDNLNTLREREAKYGGNAPLELLNQMSDHQTAIALTEQAIRGDLAESVWREQIRPLLVDIRNRGETEAACRIEIGNVGGDLIGNIIAGRDISVGGDIVTGVKQTATGQGIAQAGPGGTATVNVENIGQKIINFFAGSTEQQRELRHRQIMLQRVREFWVKGVLENSLYNEVLIELGMEERKEAVEYPWEMVIQRPHQPNRQLLPDTKIIDVFDESGGSLLILGEPGSGKTTMLLELARQLITRAQADPTQPIPVVFNLSSWVEKRLPVAEWVIEELNAKYGVSKGIAQQWVDSDNLVLLLDGLDEVATKNRADCVIALNQLPQSFMGAQVVCCRTLEYQALTTQLQLQNCIALQELTLERVYLYLAQLGPEPSSLRALIDRQPQLQTLACSPLMLSMMIMVYQNLSSERIGAAASEEVVRQYLFATYVKHMFERRGMSKNFSPEQTIKWLAFLAKTMKEHHQTTLFLEQIDGSWLPTPNLQRWSLISLRVMGASLFFVMTALCGLLAMEWLILTDEIDTVPVGSILRFGLAGGVGFGLSSVFAAKRWVIPLVVLVTGVLILVTRLDQPVSFFMAGLIFGLPGAIGGAPFARHRTVRINDSLRWNGKRSAWSVGIGGAAGVIAALVSQKDQLVNAFEVGIPIALILILLWGISRTENIESRTQPNQGIYRAMGNAFRLAGGAAFAVITFSLLLCIFSNMAGGIAFGLLTMVPVGLATWLYFGGYAGVQQSWFRFILQRNGLIASPLIDFLDYTVDRIFLRKIGPGYIFIHQWLQEYFALLKIN